MIYYFSATGNSAWVAQSIARGTGDRARSITEMRRRAEVPEPVAAGESLGLVFPIHAWAVPAYVMDFVAALQINPSAYVYVVCTCGDEAGFSIKRMRKQMQINAAFSFAMPNNYVLLANLDSPELTRKKIAVARVQLPRICELINTRASVFEVKQGSSAGLKSYVIAPLFRLTARDKAFFAEEDCNACGTCAAVCPAENIVIVAGKPQWQGHCMQCMACIHHCPLKVIQYGKSTKKRGRYLFPGPVEE